MDFRNLINTLDNINKPMLSEALTLSAVIALTSGYEHDDKVRIPKLAELAKENNLEGLVDPVTGNYVDNEGNEDDEIPFEIAEKLSAYGLLPSNARLPQAGWFDNNRVFNAANDNLRQQSSTISARHDLIAEKMHQLRELSKQMIALRDKYATYKMQDTIGEKPILPSNAPSPELARLTPTFPSQTMAGMSESAGLAYALLESFDFITEDDLSSQEWSVKNGPTFDKPIRPSSQEWSVKNGPTFDKPNRSSGVEYIKHPELTQSGSSAINNPMSRTATIAHLPGGEFTAPASTAPVKTPNTLPVPVGGRTTTDRVSIPSSTKLPPTYNGIPMSTASPTAKSGMDTSKFGKAGMSTAKHGISDIAGKVAAKTGSKLLPAIGTAYGMADMARRVSQGDYAGAGIDAASTVAAQVPVVGLPIAAGLDAYNIYRDAKAGWDEAEAADTQANSETPAKDATTDTPKTAPKNAGKVIPAATNRERIDAIKDFQTYLKTLGADLGTTGPHKDGIDGVIGPKTIAAMKLTHGNT